MSKSVVYLQALEDLKGKEYVNCRMHYVAGSKSGLAIECCIHSRYFNFYNYGFVLEVVTTDKFNNIIDISDPTGDDLKEFGINIEPAISYNVRNHSIESRNRFIYKLKDSLMCRKLGTQCISLIENEIHRSANVGIAIYLLRGALLSVAVVKEVKEESFLFEYAMGAGINLLSKDTLETVIPYVNVEHKDTDPLSQKEVDELLNQLRGIMKKQKRREQNNLLYAGRL